MPASRALTLIGATLAMATGTALAADASTPVVCGSNGCTPLPTSVLQGLLTLPDALQPADPPPAQSFLLFRVEDPAGAMHRVLYVPREGGALLGFADTARWRLVPAEDAHLLADAVADATPYPAPAAGAPLAVLFAHEGSGGADLPWTLLVGALLGLGLLGATAYVAFGRASRRSP